jgi:hypothetical protein
MPDTYLALLAKETLPLVVDDPKRIAMLRTLRRAGHVRVHFSGNFDHEQALVEALTPLGRKVLSCLASGASSRILRAFWAFGVHESRRPLAAVPSPGPEHAGARAKGSAS